MLDPAGNPFPWLLSPVLLIQGTWVRARTARLPEANGPREGRCGSGPLLRMTALGDSIIAGVGVSATDQALPARLAAALAARLGREIWWDSKGRNGARTRDLLVWEQTMHPTETTLLVISNGLNDITSLMAQPPWLQEKQRLYQRLREIAPNALIAQLGIPPLGSFPALPNPTRWILGRRAQAFDQALETLIKTLEGVIYLPFRLSPEPELFAPDGYHPGPQAVQIWAEALAEPVARALAPRLDRHPART